MTFNCALSYKHDKRDVMMHPNLGRKGKGTITVLFIASWKVLFLRKCLLTEDGHFGGKN